MLADSVNQYQDVVTDIESVTAVFRGRVLHKIHATDIESVVSIPLSSPALILFIRQSRDIIKTRIQTVGKGRAS